MHLFMRVGKSFDIVLKKMKHKMVENMSSSTADALGLSRAILCNDGLIKKMQEMEKIAAIYRGKGAREREREKEIEKEETLRVPRTCFRMHRGSLPVFSPSSFDFSCFPVFFTFNFFF